MSQNRYKLKSHQFGKKNLKILRLSTSGQLHSVRELAITHLVSINSNDEFTKDDNTNIIETDSHGNAIFILAKNKGIKSPEDFGVLFCKHMFKTYESVLKVSVYLEDVNWSRIKFDGGEKEHNKAFVNDPRCKRFAVVEMERNDSTPSITSGFKDFRVLKTTKSSFKGFGCDEYCHLKDIFDRMLSTSIECSWTYKTLNVNFDSIFKKVQDLIIFGFAGDLDEGVQSTSTQSTSYKMEKLVLDNVKEVMDIKMTLPNLYYNAFDFDQFEPTVVDEEETVFVPIENPNGYVHAELAKM